MNFSGMVKDVLGKLEELSGRLSLSIIFLNDYEVFLGQEFM